MSEAALPTSPYKGLMPYSEEDAPYFFGRDAEREIITANLMASRLTVLYGASGVGKSSVLRAGVSHHLRGLARRALAGRGSPEFAVVVFASWRDDPLAGLRARVADSVALALDGRTPEPVPPSPVLAESLQAWAERAGGELFIILDQFEEYFLYHPSEDGEGTFAVEFPRAVNRPDLRVSFLVSIREDSLAKLDRFKGRIPNLFDNYLRLDHLDYEAARAAIERPIERYNRLRAGDGQPVSIEPALVNAVLEQVTTGRVVLGDAGRGAVEGRPTEARIETPYLQLVMTRLWDEEMGAGSQVLRLEMLNRLGGADRIVRTHLDDVMNRLSPGRQDTAARVFHHLVTPGGTKIAHTVPDLAEYAELAPMQVKPVLEGLSSAEIRILRPVAPSPDQPAALRYEIFHDVLTPAVLDWRERFLRGEIEEHRLELLYAEAQEAIEKKRWTHAGGDLAKIREIRPNYRDVAKLDETVTRCRQKRKRLARANAVIIMLTTALLGYLSGVWLAERLAARTSQDLALSTMGALAAMSGLYVGAMSSSSFLREFRVDLLNVRGVEEKHIAIRILCMLLVWLSSEWMILLVGLVGWGAGALTLWVFKRFTGFYVVVWGWGTMAALAALGFAIPGASEPSDPPTGDDSQSMEPSPGEDTLTTARRALERRRRQ